MDKCPTPNTPAVQNEDVQAASAGDRLEIVELHGRYALAADERDAAAYADIFTPDGAFVGRVGQPDELRIAGRAALIKFIERLAAASHPGTDRGRQGRHLSSSTIFVELDGERALTRTYLAFISSTADEPPSLGLTSIYEDRLIKTDDGWRIAERRALPDVKGDLFSSQRLDRD